MNISPEYFPRIFQKKKLCGQHSTLAPHMMSLSKVKTRIEYFFRILLRNTCIEVTLRILIR